MFKPTLDVHAAANLEPFVGPASVAVTLPAVVVAFTVATVASVIARPPPKEEHLESERAA